MRHGHCIAVVIVFLARPIGRAGADPVVATPDSTRVALSRSVPTLLRGDGLAGRTARTGVSRPHAWVASPGPGDDAVEGFLVLPDGPANRPSVVDLRRSPDRPPVGPRVRRSQAPLVERLLWNDDLVFGSVAAAKPEVYDGSIPHGFLAKIGPGGAAEIAVAVPSPGPLADSRVTIRVMLAPTHEGQVQLGATWGATSLGPAIAVRGAGLSTISFACNAAQVPSDGAPLVLLDATPSIPPTTADDTSDDRGAIWIDSVEIRAVLTAPGVLRAEIEPDVHVRLAEVDVATAGRPHVDAPDPVAAAKGADEVILTTTATAAGAARLAAHRSATGVRAVAIPFADVVDRSGRGTGDPELVGRYLSQLAASGTAPRFLLLAGDAMRDVVDDPANSIPTAYGRTMYNGATASDRLLVRAGLAEGVRAPSVGRLPFRDAAVMDAYVDRVVANETKPPADASRRMVRFVTSEGRFGPMIDGLLENLFTNIVAEEIPPAYDVEVTFASPKSAFCWPPSRFHQKVIGGLNAGALFYTYVGHGWAEGFDHLRVGSQRFPILRSSDVAQVDVAGTPPAMFVVACTTATFDDPAQTGVGELLVSRPRGPIAYWGATRVCHPAWNAFIGRQIAMTIFQDPERRIGEVLDAAVRGVLEPERDPADRTQVKDKGRKLIEMGARALTPGTVPVDRLLEEGAWMYALLGDPAVRLALPRSDLSVAATLAAGADGTIDVRVEGPIADGTRVDLSLEVPRNVLVARALPTTGDADAVMEARHASSNDKAIAQGEAVAKAGVASASLVWPAAWRGRAVTVKAWCVSRGDVHQGATPVGASR